MSMMRFLAAADRKAIHCPCRFIKRLALYPLVILFIVFDEVIYRRIVAGLFDIINSWGVMRLIDDVIAAQNRYVTLLIFLLCFVLGEGLGMVSLAAAVAGHIIIAALVYVMKIMLALYAFVILKQQHDKLFSFGWFRYAYGRVEALIDRIKATQVYTEIDSALSRVRRYFVARSRKGSLLIKVKRVAARAKARG